MLTILLCLFPALFIIVGIYLMIFKESLIRLLPMDNASKIITTFTITFISMAILGGLLVFMPNKLFFIIWMVISLILVSLLALLLYQAVK